MAKPVNLLLAVLRKRLSDETDKLKRAELKDKIRTLTARLARAEFEAKAGPVRREMWGAY